MTSTFEDVVDGVSTSTAVKAPVRCATTANITLSGFQTIDGVTLTSSDENLRVLVWNQTDATENGIYDAKTGSWERSADFDGARDVRDGTLVRVTEGSTYAGAWFEVTTDDPITIGTTSLTFSTSTFPLDEVQQVNGMAALRGLSPTVGSVLLNYHTTAGDGGHGEFRGVVGASPGTYTDDNGITIVPTGGDGSAAWLRIYSGAIHAHWFGAVGDGATDDTSVFNNAIGALPSSGGTVTCDYTKSYLVSAQAGTSPNDFATEDSDPSPDAPEDSAILLRNKTNIEIDFGPAEIICGNAYAVCMYKSENCHVLGGRFTYSGTMGSSQPSSVAIVRSTYSGAAASSATGFYRNFLCLKSAESGFEKTKSEDSTYFSTYISGLLDVSVNSKSDLVSKKWSNFAVGCAAYNSKYGSYFPEWAIAVKCESYDCNNAAVACNHFTSQTGPYRAYFCTVHETSNQNSGNTIDGFNISPGSAGVGSLAVSGSELIGNTVIGCYQAFKGRGFENVKIHNNTAEDYYATGFGFASDNIGGSDYHIRGLSVIGNIDKGLNSSSTRTAVGNVKIAGFQFEKNSTADLTDIIFDGNVANVDDGGAVTPSGTAYDIYFENASNVEFGRNIIRGTQGTFGYRDVAEKSALKAISNAQLKALAATPIEVVSAPGSGKFIYVLGWRFRLIFGSTAMDDAAADGDLTLEYDGGATIDTMEADGLVDATATTQGLSGNLTELLVAESGADNKAVDISNDGAEFTGASSDSTAEVEVFYRILDSNPS